MILTPSDSHGFIFSGAHGTMVPSSAATTAANPAVLLPCRSPAVTMSAGSRRRRWKDNWVWRTQTHLRPPSSSLSDDHKTGSSSSSAPAVSPSSTPLSPFPPPETGGLGRKGLDLGTLNRLWKVAAPYWFSDDKVQARLRLAGVFGLTLATTGISVGFSFLGRDFYNALANKDQEQFTKQLLYYLCGFAGGIPFFVLRDYARETLSLRWRSWMTNYYLKNYFANRTFYRIQSQSIIDNPDQRIVDDLSSFTGTSLSFSLTLFNAFVDLISFSNILYGIYPPLFLVLIGYSIVGTAVSVFLGKGLVTLNFLQEKKEADFRYGLVRVRENSESIAFYGGEENELQLLLQRFKSAFENLTKLLISSRNLEFFTNGYRYLIQILPAAVVAPMYFSGKIEFGVINQSVSAFNHILGDFSLVVYQFQAISAFSAVIERLGEFDDLISSSSSEFLSNPFEEIHLAFCNAETSCSESSGNMPMVTIENLTLQTPAKTTLIWDLSLMIDHKDHLLIKGPSGSGKTSLLRAMAGLWNTGRGKITFYEIDTEDPWPNSSSNMAVAEAHKINGDLDGLKKKLRGIFFLPQRPYMVLGTLRRQLLYPNWTEPASFMPDDATQADRVPVNGKLAMPTTEDLLRTLDDVGLGYIVPSFGGLDSMHEWSSVLSLGEQQRLAFARLLLSRPSLALLDESTSALDEANEARLYREVEAVGITYISVGHRRTLYEYHDKILHISTPELELELEAGGGGRHNWHIETLCPDNLSPHRL